MACVQPSADLRVLPPAHRHLDVIVPGPPQQGSGACRACNVVIPGSVDAVAYSTRTAISLGLSRVARGSASELATSDNTLSAVWKSDAAELAMTRVLGHTMAMHRAGCSNKPSHSESDSASQLREPSSGGSNGSIARTASKNEARSTIPFAGKTNVVYPAVRG